MREPAMRRFLAGLAILGLVVSAMGCDIDTDFADNLVDQTADRNRRRALEMQRRELPLPDPDEIDYIAVIPEQIEPTEDFVVSFVDDLVVGDDEDEPKALFTTFIGRASALGNVAVGADGRIYVLETRSDEVRVFDPEGGFLFAFGQPGEGPGDFNAPFGLNLAGDRVHVHHRRFYSSIWDLEGNFLRDRQTLRTPEALEAERLDASSSGTNATSASEARRRDLAQRFRTPSWVHGRPDGSMVMVTHARPSESRGRIATSYVVVVGRYEDGAEAQRYLEAPDWATPSVAVAPDGGVYVALFGHLRTEYYLLSLDPAGEPRWVLTIPWDTDTPPRADLRVDEQGRLFVMPNFLLPAELFAPKTAEGAAEAKDDLRDAFTGGVTGETLRAVGIRPPVQVYSRDGEIIGSGYLDRYPTHLHWQTAAGDRVYGVRVNPDSGEWEVVRYRLEARRERPDADPGLDFPER